MRVYAIGDLHGHLEALQAMHLKIDMHLSDYPIEKAVIIYLGDYIDRGPESAQIVERLSLLQKEISPISRHFIKGNHEWALQEFLEHPLQCGPYYLKWGGLETVESYGVEIPSHVTQSAIIQGAILPAEYERLSLSLKEKIPPHHIEFLDSLEYSLQIGGYLFVHAGIRPKVPLKEQDPQDLMRIRDDFLAYTHAHEYRVVHGHTITPDVVIKDNRIGLDTGFFETGRLSCGVLEKERVDILQIQKEIFNPWIRP